jgi:hypothetical protein
LAATDKNQNIQCNNIVGERTSCRESVVAYWFSIRDLGLAHVLLFGAPSYPPLKDCTNIHEKEKVLQME